MASGHPRGTTWLHRPSQRDRRKCTKARNPSELKQFIVRYMEQMRTLYLAYALVAIVAVSPAMVAQTTSPSPANERAAGGAASSGQPAANPPCANPDKEPDEKMWARLFPCKEYYAKQKPG